MDERYNSFPFSMVYLAADSSSICPNIVCLLLLLSVFKLKLLANSLAKCLLNAW